MKIRVKQYFHSYSDQAIDTFVNSAVGIPFKDSDGEILGTVDKVERTDDPKVLDVTVKLSEDFDERS